MTNSNELLTEKTPSSSLVYQARARLELRRRGGGSKSSFVITYRNDPVAFIHDCILWHNDQHPAGYQDEILGELIPQKRVSVRGPHGLGKTALMAWTTLWFSLVHDMAGEDWKIPTTASAWRQLIKFLWPEIHKWARLLNWTKIGRNPFKERDELMGLSLKLTSGEAFALASNNSDLIEGAHASHLLYIFDESKSIETATWDSAEGAFSSGEALWLACSTPGEPNGRFYEIQSRKAGYEDWWVKHITLAETVQAGRVNMNWANDRRKQWGENSAVYLNRVEGEFASGEEDGIIPLSWIEKANERWLVWKDGDIAGDFTCVGVDVARSGEDNTVLALRFGEVITELRRYSKEDTMSTTGRVAGILEGRKGYAVVDVIGIGAGVVDRLREMNCPVKAFNASEHTDFKDRSGELGFTNTRSAAWWNLRELLDPANEHEIALPPDDLLTGDLTSPHWRITSTGKIEIESKETIKARIGRSTDDGDAVVQAFWRAVIQDADEWVKAYSNEMTGRTNMDELPPGSWDKPRRMG